MNFPASSPAPSRPTPTAAPLAIRGEFTVATIAAWHQRLVLPSGADESVLDLSGITTADVFGVQLLCAFHRAAAARSLRHRIEKAPPALLGAALAAGIAPTAFLTDTP